MYPAIHPQTELLMSHTVTYAKQYVDNSGQHSLHGDHPNSNSLPTLRTNRMASSEEAFPYVSMPLRQPTSQYGFSSAKAMPYVNQLCDEVPKFNRMREISLIRPTSNGTSPDSSTFCFQGTSNMSSYVQTNGFVEQTSVGHLENENRYINSQWTKGGDAIFGHGFEGIFHYTDNLQPQARDDDNWYETKRRDSTSSASSNVSGSEGHSPTLSPNDNGQKEQSSGNLVLPPCRICGAKASGFHYGVNSCEACKGFFRRSLKRPIIFFCTKDKTCDVKGNRRSTCRFCRYKRCLSLGMSRDAIKTGRYSHNKRTSDTIEVKQLQNNPVFPLDEPDFDSVLHSLMAAHEAELSLSSSRGTGDSIYSLQMEYLSLYKLKEKGKSDTTDLNPCNTADAATTTNASDECPASDNVAKSVKSKRTDSNQCSNSNNTYSYNDCFAVEIASPSLSSSSTDSGFNDNFSADDERERSKVTSLSAGALDLTMKTKNLHGKTPSSGDTITHSSYSDLNGTSCSLDMPDEWSSDLIASTLIQEQRRPCETHAVCDRIVGKSVPFSCDDQNSAIKVKRKFENSENPPPKLHETKIKRRRLEQCPDVCLEKNSDQSSDLKTISSSSRHVNDKRSNQTDVCNTGDKIEGINCFQSKIDYDTDSTITDSDADDGKVNEDSYSRVCASMESECDNDVSIERKNQIYVKKSVSREDIALDSCDNRLKSVKSTCTTSVQRAERWVTEYIRFAKSIPGFNDFSSQTIGVLLRLAWDEIWMLQAYTGYNSEHEVAVMPSGKCFHKEEIIEGWGLEYTEVAFDVATVLRQFNLSQEMIVLLKAICIVSPDRCPASCREKADQIHWLLVTCLLKYLETIGEASTFPKLVSVLTSLRDLSEMAHSNLSRGQLDQSFGGALFPDCGPHS